MAGSDDKSKQSTSAAAFFFLAVVTPPNGHVRHIRKHRCIGSRRSLWRSCNCECDFVVGQRENLGAGESLLRVILGPFNNLGVSYNYLN